MNLFYCTEYLDFVSLEEFRSRGGKVCGEAEAASDGAAGLSGGGLNAVCDLNAGSAQSLECGAASAAGGSTGAAAGLVQLQLPTKLIIREQEALHAAKVLRLKIGDRAMFCDGEGAMYVARFSKIGSYCEAEIDEVWSFRGQRTVLEERKAKIRMIVAPTKHNDRLESFIDKAVELGVENFSFVCTERCLRNKLQDERIEKIMLSAMKQSLQAYKPSFDTLQSFKSFVRGLIPPCVQPIRLIAYCGEEYPKVDFFEFLCKNSSEIKERGIEIMIGPEGDFTTEEVASVVDKGFVPVSLGKTRLRVETAALYAASLAMAQITSKE